MNARTLDHAEAAANVAAGFAVSVLAVWAIRATGAWQAPAWVISAVFSVLSFARVRVLRAAFRGVER
jgi:hypothetical protein